MEKMDQAQQLKQIIDKLQSFENDWESLTKLGNTIFPKHLIEKNEILDENKEWIPTKMEKTKEYTTVLVRVSLDYVITWALNYFYSGKISIIDKETNNELFAINSHEPIYWMNKHADVENPDKTSVVKHRGDYYTIELNQENINEYMSNIKASKIVEMNILLQNN